MAKWHFFITPEAEEDLAHLDKQIKERVIEKLKWFVHNFDRATPIPLGNQLRGLFKLRVGDWRIIYEMDNQNCEAVIHAIGRRDEIYKRKK